VPAVAVIEKALALAAAVVWPADADMIEVAEAKAMHREAATADIAADLTDRLTEHTNPGRDAEDADAVVCRGTDEANGAFRFRRRGGRFGHAGLDLVSSRAAAPPRFLHPSPPPPPRSGEGEQNVLLPLSVSGRGRGEE